MVVIYNDVTCIGLAVMIKLPRNTIKIMIALSNSVTIIFSRQESVTTVFTTHKTSSIIGYGSILLSMPLRQ